MFGIADPFHVFSGRGSACMVQEHSKAGGGVERRVCDPQGHSTRPRELANIIQNFKRIYMEFDRVDGRAYLHHIHTLRKAWKIDSSGRPAKSLSLSRPAPFNTRIKMKLLTIYLSVAGQGRKYCMKCKLFPASVDWTKYALENICLGTNTYYESTRQLNWNSQQY